VGSHENHHPAEFPETTRTAIHSYLVFCSAIPITLQNLQEHNDHACPHLIRVTRDANNVKHLGRNDSGPEPNRVENAASSDRHLPVAETWVTLCAQAAIEQDPKRLLDLVIEINRLLDVRRKRLEQAYAAIDSSEPEDR
jgi:hypothetical protein